MSSSVTVALLIYKSPEWLEWCLRRIAAARNATSFDVLVVGNDANTRVVEWVQRAGIRDASGEYGVRVDGSDRFFRFRYVDHRNADPYEYDMARVYRAWNRAVAEARTDDVVLVNSDMAFGDGWLDELLDLRARWPKCLPTSLLVESGRLVSGLPDEVRDFGRLPSTFRADEFMEHARVLRAGSRDNFSGGLFQPVLFRRDQFIDAGGYPIQKPDHSLASDAVFFNSLAEKFGLEHRTACRSVCYHIQLGESWDEP